MLGDLNIRAFKIDDQQDINILIEQWDDSNGDLYMAKPLEMEKRPRSDAFAPDVPITTISPTVAQQLMDDLCDCGFSKKERGK